MSNSSGSVLSNVDLEKYSKYFHLPLVGVFMKDELPSKRKDGLYILNMANHNEDGTHWTCFGIHKGKSWYSDSFAVGCPSEVEEFLEKYKPITYSTRQIQKIDSSFCGWAVLLVSYFMYNFPKIKSLDDKLKHFLNYFSEGDQELNEIIIKKLFDKIILNHRNGKNKGFNS